MTAGLSLMKSVLTPLAKSVLLPFGSSAVMSTTNGAIQRKSDGSGTTALIILNNEIEYIMKIVKSVKESGFLIKRINETIENKPRKQKCGLFQKVLGTLAASLLGSLIGRVERAVSLVKNFIAASFFN